MKQSGIYLITDQTTGIVYVGSAVNIAARWKHHRIRLRSNQHGNIKLQNAWNLRGEDKFEFAIVEPVEDSRRLLEQEQYWIDRLEAVGPHGFNILPIAGSHLGRKRGTKTRERLAAAAMGNNRGIGNKANLGRKLPAITCKRMSEGKRGNKNAVGNKNHLGHKHGPEALAKMSAASNEYWSRRQKTA